MSAIRKQLRWDDTTDMWPITDASAVHYTYNPSDSSKILSPVLGVSYGLDNFLNGLVNRILTQDDIVAAATNVNRGKGILYNTSSSVTGTALPSAGTSNAFVKCTYTSAGALSLAFDTTTYLPTSTTYAGSTSVGGAASAAVKLNGGGAGLIVYLSAANTTAFLAAGTDGYALVYDATNSKPKWASITSNVSSALYVGGSGNLTGNAAQSTNGNVYITLKEGSTYYKHNIVGTGRATVTCDANGKITINSSNHSNFTVATDSAAGTAGLVPAPATNLLGSSNYYLRADCTWAIPPNNAVTLTATSDSKAYEILFSGTNDNTTRTEGVRKTSTLTYNPSTKALSTGGTVNGLTLSSLTTGFKISGGTTSKILTVSADYTLAAACAKGVTDSSSASAIGTGSNLTTERDVYYGLPTINGGHSYTSNSTFFAPTSAGTAGLILQSGGNGNAPSWVDTENYTTTTITSSEYSLQSGNWTEVSTSITTAGTYALYIIDSTNGSYAGVFAINGASGEKLEEIPLHWATASTTTTESLRVYAALKEGKLLLASNDSTATSYTLTIKYKRII